MKFAGKFPQETHIRWALFLCLIEQSLPPECIRKRARSKWRRQIEKEETLGDSHTLQWHVRCDSSQTFLASLSMERLFLSMEMWLRINYAPKSFPGFAPFGVFVYLKNQMVSPRISSANEFKTSFMSLNGTKSYRLLSRWLDEYKTKEIR